MIYYIAQVLGIFVTIGAIISMQLKNKKHILPVSALINILAALNILLLDQFGSGVIINCVAVIQVIVSLWHDRKGTEPSKAEKAVFLVVYIACGLIGFRTWLDILPIVAVVFYMFAVFQKDEQKLRVFMIGNGVSWTIYHGAIGSTAIFAQIANVISALIALYRYRNQKNKEVPSVK